MLLSSIGLAILGIALALFLWRPPSVALVSPAPASVPALSALARSPDWASLNAFQDSITRENFVRLLTTVFTTGDVWKTFIDIHEAEAIIRTGNARNAELYHLRFATNNHSSPPPRHWKSAADLPAADSAKPLAGLHIAIDPGHIGGAWAQIEERWFVIANTNPICEGNLTLTVAKLLKPRLEALGATVSLVRENNEPVTSLRPSSLLSLARQSADPAASPAVQQKLAERLFYRTAEIHARAKLVNDSIKPDLVLCLHFNADPWGDPRHPKLVKRSHLHLLLNGAYTDEELTLADQRYALLEKLLSQTHQEEVLIGTSVAEAFAEHSGLQPFLYPAASSNALPVDGNPYLWARNLLANRLYDCPVIFIEPYVMNSSTDCPRLQAGDYPGFQKVNGKPRPSIFREYADSLADGLARYYSGHRGNTQ